jgi:hypothetical protein
LYVRSQTRGTTRTITCNGTVTVSYCDFEDIVGAGTANWDISAATGGSGDCGGNSGIIFTTPITCYAKTAVSANLSSSIWYTTSGGSTQSRFPLPQDTMRFDANSITASGVTITNTLIRLGSIDWTGTLNNPTFAYSGGYCYGSFTLVAGMSFAPFGANTYTYFVGRSNTTITTNGRLWNGHIAIESRGGSVSLTDSLTLTTAQQLQFSLGTFNTNNNNMTFNGAGGIGFGVGVKTVNLGTSLITFNVIGAGSTGASIWYVTTATGLTLNASSSSMKVLGSWSTNPIQFNGGDLTYGSFELAGTSTIPFLISGSNTFTTFKVNPGRKITFAAPTTTATTWDFKGTAGNLITIASNTTTARTLVKSGGGTVNAEYCTISYSNATPSSTFYAWSSTDGGNNTGWNISASPNPANSANNLFFGSNF